MKETKVVFLDRDGVINRDRGSASIDNWKKFRFIPGSLKALKLLKENGFKTVVVSNQAGVAKGFYSRTTLQHLTRRMKEEVEAGGGRLDAVYYCTHQQADHCRCRKPRTGLLRKAKEKFHFRYKDSFIVGDSQRDMAAGKVLRLKTVLVLSGREKLSRRALWEVHPDAVKKNLLEAVRWILHREP